MAGAAARPAAGAPGAHSWWNSGMEMLRHRTPPSRACDQNRACQNCCRSSDTTRGDGDLRMTTGDDTGDSDTDNERE